MLTCRKNWFIDCKLQKRKNFGFDNVLCTFIFDMVPSVSPKNYVRGNLRP
jgi:hypothetical protein